MSERTITMTVYAIQANLVDVTTWTDAPNSRFIHGYITVSAEGHGERHEWNLKPGHRCWIGDRVDVTVVEDDPEPWPPPTPMDVPPIDKRV